MDECVWVFQRGSERLELCRHETDEGLLLVIDGAGEPRSYMFPDLPAAVTFQSDMEAFLLKTGWSFVAFIPERRSGLDRRQWPRMEDRRRWWTDGLRLLHLPKRRPGRRDA